MRKLKKKPTQQSGLHRGSSQPFIQRRAQQGGKEQDLPWLPTYPLSLSPMIETANCPLALQWGSKDVIFFVNSQLYLEARRWGGETLGHKETPGQNLGHLGLQRQDIRESACLARSQPWFDSWHPPEMTSEHLWPWPQPFQNQSQGQELVSLEGGQGLLLLWAPHCVRWSRTQ